MEWFGFGIGWIWVFQLELVGVEDMDIYLVFFLLFLLLPFDFDFLLPLIFFISALCMHDFLYFIFCTRHGSRALAVESIPAVHISFPLLCSRFFILVSRHTTAAAYIARSLTLSFLIFYTPSFLILHAVSICTTYSLTIFFLTLRVRFVGQLIILLLLVTYTCFFFCFSLLFWSWVYNWRSLI